MEEQGAKHALGSADPGGLLAPSLHSLSTSGSGSAETLFPLPGELRCALLHQIHESASQRQMTSQAQILPVIASVRMFDKVKDASRSWPDPRCDSNFRYPRCAAPGASAHHEKVAARRLQHTQLAARGSWRPQPYSKGSGDDIMKSWLPRSLAVQGYSRYLGMVTPSNRPSCGIVIIMPFQTP